MMTDDRRGGNMFGGGMFAPNVPQSPVGGPNYPQYFNLDPSYMAPGSEFIVPEGAQQTRGRFELAFLQIGSSVIVGSIGGTVGSMFTNRKLIGELFSQWKGRKGIEKEDIKKEKGRTNIRAQIFNVLSKPGGVWAKKCGVIALLYSGVGTLFGLTRQHMWSQDDDAINTMAAATATGVLYSLPKALGTYSGFRPIAKHLCKGGLVGAGFGVAILGSDYFLGVSGKGRRAWYY